MDDVRLTATNPEDSSVVPVACNSKGELLLEEPIQGPPGQDGQDGAPGEQGPPGKDGIDGIPLPPDPYEGAILGWLNNGLAWIGTPPVPIPEGVFGPIISWSRESSYLEVEGPIPEDVGNGVYVYQCNERGDYFTEGWNTSQVWSDKAAGLPASGTEITNATDGKIGPSSLVRPVNGTEIEWDFSSSPVSGSLEIYSFLGSGNSGAKLFVNDVDKTSDLTKEKWSTISGISSVSKIKISSVTDADYVAISGIKVDGKILVDSNKSLSMRVNQVLGNGLVGVASADVEFSVGKYLFVPGQRVAPWVLYEGDPTSRIDYLRQTRD